MNPIKVMIVEDDAKIADLHRRFAEKVEGFEVVAIAQGLDDAKEMIEIFEPDLILLDLYFPEGTSFEMLREIRTKGLETDVILITAAREMGPLKEALRGGVFDYIIKPVILDRFKACLSRFGKYHSRLHNSETLEQKDVDSMRHPASSASASTPSEDLPKGIDPLTLKKVQDVFKDPDTENGLGAEEVGSLIGASRSTTRRYLEYLVSVGFIYPDLVYGTVGRPERKYFRN
ncbi:response regulator [Maridesulfovibrio ferrireducens]|uniref:response regulator n=1 Tax=Maridesulfovibrio ferrireducens TaxID=246191 RepID=UPI001A191DB3|nr:response regulator [Maridesulfovibrio ferrireducens]MBI9111886.1 response regulator [Maridesulfovibrio ferrireducens]